MYVLGPSPSSAPAAGALEICLMPCFGAGPWRVARETVGQLRRCTQKRGEWVTQAAFSDTAPPPHYVEKGLRDLFHPQQRSCLLFLFWIEQSAPPAALAARNIPQGAKWSQPPKSPLNTPQWARVNVNRWGPPGSPPSGWQAAGALAETPSWEQTRGNY